MVADDKTAGRITQYGFDFGAAKVERAWSDKGYVGLMIRTGRQIVDITITPKGFIRVSPVQKDRFTQ